MATLFLVQILKLLLLIITVPMLCYLAGSVYNTFIMKKNRGTVSSCLTGLIFLLFYLFIIQLFVVKMDWTFRQTSRCYTAFFLAIVLLGTIARFVMHKRGYKYENKHQVTKKEVILYVIIVLQGILCIGLKNPYFKDNGLMEMTKVILDTDSIYDYNAFTGVVCLKGFPLSNKLMVMPQLYAYLSDIFGLEVSLLYNYAIPILTFISYYAVMILCCKKMEEESQIAWQRLLFAVILLTQLGDYWTQTVSFRVLHSGYMGEAVLLGIIVPFIIYEIKNNSYSICMLSIFSVPLLIKYDTIFELIMDFSYYLGQAGYHGGMWILYVISVLWLFFGKHGNKMEILNVNLTISYCLCQLWNWICTQKKDKRVKVLSGCFVTLVLLLSGNLTFVSDATEWRSNVYGAEKEEYQVLSYIANEAYDGDVLKVMACAEVNQWINRLDLPIDTVVGHDMDTLEVGWYSYEEYDANYTRLWENINQVTNNLELELMELIDLIEMDYIILNNATDILPIRDNERIQYCFQTPSYTVYSVDK